MKSVLNNIYKSSFAYTIINKDIQNNMLNHAYLLSGDDDALNKFFCVEIAKHILCGNDDAPCDECVTCKKISHSNCVDIKIHPEKNKNFVVEDANAIVDDCLIKPYENEKKIYIINNFENATIQAQNKLLKTIEEPNGCVVFLINTKNSNKVLNTILSRCKKIFVGNVSKENINLFLKEKNIDKADVISNISVGNLTKAIELSENEEIFKINELAISVFESLINSSQVLEYSYKFISFSAHIQTLLENLINVAYDIAMLKNGKQNTIINKHAQKRLENILNIYNIKMLNKIVEQINEANLKLQSNCNIQSVVDSLLMNILEAKYKCKQ